jgi:hypothetical protein
MRFYKAKVVSISLFLVAGILSNPAHASLNAPINLNNPRVVPIYWQDNASQIANQAGWSGYLYSPRIVFTAAHSNYRFDNSGNRILSEAKFITVGKPNSAASSKVGRVKVIKTFVGDYKKSNAGAGALNDFIVYVLEKDLVSISTGELLTAEIEKELVAAQTEVSMHGYGEYQDRCAPSQSPPCKEDRNNPKKRTSELPRSPTGSMKLVAPSYFPWLDGERLKDLVNETLLSDNLACSGDSGGPVMAQYKGVQIYLGTTPLGFTPGYYCGAGTSRVSTQPAGMFSPVYKHLDLIAAAESYIKTSSLSTAKKSITCVKGNLNKKVTGTNPKCPTGYTKA